MTSTDEKTAERPAEATVTDAPKTVETKEETAPPAPVPVDDDEIDEDDDSDVTTDENKEDLKIYVGEQLPEEVLRSRLESLIFICPEPITVRRLAKHLALPGTRVRELLKQLQEQYQNRGIVLSEIGGGFQFHTNPANAEVIRTFTKIKPLRMSRPALETLAIVAYKQPCTRAEVEDVRRVDCGGTLKFLFEKELIRVLGRKEEPGRPIIYGTSNKFLKMFNLKSLADLPSLHEYTELWDEHQELVDEQSDGDDAPLKRDAKATQEELPLADEPQGASDAAPEPDNDEQPDEQSANNEATALPTEEHQ